MGIKMVEEDQRRHVRVDCWLKVDCQKILQEDYKRLQNNPEIIFKNTFGELFKTPEIKEINLELLYKLIYQANLKMDRILEMLGSKDIGKHTSAESECVNISGSGMRFITNRRFAIGDVIALRIFLPIASQTRINVLGKVTSLEKSDIDKKYNIAVTFVGLPEGDRDMIIGYIFSRQREMLKLSFDSSDGGK